MILQQCADLVTSLLVVLFLSGRLTGHACYIFHHHTAARSHIYIYILSISLTLLLHFHKSQRKASKHLLLVWNLRITLFSTQMISIDLLNLYLQARWSMFTLFEPTSSSILLSAYMLNILIHLNKKQMRLSYVLNLFFWRLKTQIGLTLNRFVLPVLVLKKNKHLELLTAGHSNNSDTLHSADDGISNHDSLSKHLFCNHCEAILATTYLYRSHSQHKMRMWCIGIHYQQPAGKVILQTRDHCAVCAQSRLSWIWV